MNETLYGVRAIAASLGLKYRQAHHLAEQGLIPTYRIGRTICSTKHLLGQWQLANEARAQEVLSKVEGETDQS